jgi:hypothetical protein
MKKCSKCQQVKPVSEFHLRVASKGYYQSQCKICSREADRAYDRSPRGMAIGAWYSLVRRANNRDGNHPTYAGIGVKMSKEQFLEWAIPRYEAWDREGTPTVDRMDDTKDYEISNLQLISKAANSSKTRSTLKIMGLGKVTSEEVIAKIVQAVREACAKYKISIEEVVKELEE